MTPSHRRAKCIQPRGGRDKTWKAGSVSDVGKRRERAATVLALLDSRKISVSCSAVDNRGTTLIVQRYLDELASAEGDASAEPVVRALLSKSVDRLRSVCV